MNVVKLIKVADNTHERLTKLGQKTDTYDTIIVKLLDHYEGKNKK